MVTVYTDRNKIKDDYKLIEYNDVYFDAYVADNINNEDIAFMKEIDNVIEYDARSNRIETPYGVCSIYELSTGYKTLLNLLHLKDGDKLIISLNECGANVMNMIFKLIDSGHICSDVYVNIGTEVVKCDSELQFNVNGSGQIVDKFRLVCEMK